MSKLSIEKQIDYMKEKGVKFSIYSEKDAKDFLLYNTYHTKIMSYSQNYPIVGQNQFYKLDFAYLVELSTLDMYVRRFFMRICLDIEHSLKTQLMRDCYENNCEDGYSIVNKFLVRNPLIKESIDYEYKKINAKEFQCSYMDQIYLDYYPIFSLWQIVEILSLGEFSLLYELYYEIYPTSFSYTKFIQSVRKVRNICAHNSCLIDSLRKTDKNQIEPTTELTSFIGQFMGMSAKNKLKTAAVHDITSVLYLFDKIVKSNRLKMYTYKELKGTLIEDRLILKKEYFSDNFDLKSNYKYFKNLVDKLYSVSESRLNKHDL